MEPTIEANATVVRRRDLHDGLFFLWIRPDAVPYRKFAPGQYVSIGRPEPEGGRPILRTYSIGSCAQQREELELFVVHVDDGAFSTWLRDCRPGVRLWLSPRAQGNFTLEGTGKDTNLVLVATGTGVAPYFSMYRTFRRKPRWRRVILINGARFANDLGYRNELEALAARDPDFIYLPLVTRERPDSGWSGLRGRVQSVLDSETFAALTGSDLDPRTCHVFLCGNPSMVDDVEKKLAAQGFERFTGQGTGSLHLEKYW